MKKSLLTLAGVSLLSVGLSASTLTNEVHAAKVTAGKTAKVIHTAYVYNSKGKRVKKTSLKKNKTTKVIKIVKIKGKSYAQIGKNQFVKLSNLSGISKSKKVKKRKIHIESDNVIEPTPSKKITPQQLEDLGFEKMDPEDYVDGTDLGWFHRNDGKDGIGIKMVARKDTVISIKDDVVDGSDSEVSYTVKFPKDSYVYWFGEMTVNKDRSLISTEGNFNYILSDENDYNSGIRSDEMSYSINLNDVKLIGISDNEESNLLYEKPNVRLFPRNGKFNTKNNENLDFNELKSRGLIKDIYFKQK